MDAVKTLARWKDMPLEQWLAQANRVLPPLAVAVLVIAIADQLATLTWTVAPRDFSVDTIPEIARTGAAQPDGPATDYEPLRRAHLFGEPPTDAPAPASVQRIVDAPDTTLSLELTGIVAREAGERGQAIIASARGSEKIYSVGDAVEGASGATLHAVYADRVILNRGANRLETLRLPRELAGTAAARRPAAAPPPVPAPSAGTLRQVISDNASRITEVIRPQPHIEGGQVIGFRLNPGRNRAAFDALGLEPGDVVTDVNGTMLNDASAGLRLFEALGEATMANVTVLRDGTPQTLVIDTTQLAEMPDQPAAQNGDAADGPDDVE